MDKIPIAVIDMDFDDDGVLLQFMDAEGTMTQVWLNNKWFRMLAGGLKGRFDYLRIIGKYKEER